MQRAHYCPTSSWHYVVSATWNEESIHTICTMRSITMWNRLFDGFIQWSFSDENEAMILWELVLIMTVRLDPSKLSVSNQEEDRNMDVLMSSRHASSSHSHHHPALENLWLQRALEMLVNPASQAPRGPGKGWKVQIWTRTTQRGGRTHAYFSDPAIPGSDAIQRMDRLRKLLNRSPISCECPCQRPQLTCSLGPNNNLVNRTPLPDSECPQTVDLCPGSSQSKLEQEANPTEPATHHNSSLHLKMVYQSTTDRT